MNGRSLRVAIILYATVSVLSKPLRKRNVYDPAPLIPTNNGVASEQDNPYLDVMQRKHDAEYGLSLGLFPGPIVFGGSVFFPTGNMMRPTENVYGGFARGAPTQVRFGTKFGPSYPWQDNAYVKAVKQVDEAYNREHITNNIHPDGDLPPLPPQPFHRMF